MTDLFGRSDDVETDRNTQQNVTLGRFRAGDRAPLDFYETPREATEALIYHHPSLLDKPILEPCAGNGAISRVVQEFAGKVESWDITEREFPLDGVWNFLSEEGKEDDVNIITNPPYEHALPFIRKSLAMVLPGNHVCFLLRVLFLEGIERRKLFDEHPPVEVAVFSKRIHFPRA
ncbi:MAG: hypothetical protein FWH21_00585 [Kiritimatiellaeota bacterium]|nr:hypothetical protein [Kiritimatiellota bacterium]